MNKKLIQVILLFVAFTFDVASAAERMPASFVEKRFSVNFQQTDIKDVIRLLGVQGEVKIHVDETLQGKVSYNFANVTLDTALRQIAKENKLNIYMDNGTIFVDKQDASMAGPAPASVNGAQDGEGGDPNQVFSIPIRYSSAKYILDKLPKVTKSSESLIIDDTANSLIFYGGANTYNKLLKFVKAFDLMPSQILIEGQIIETSKNFTLDLGTQLGSESSGPAYIDSSNAKVPVGSGNIRANLLLGWIDSSTLDLKIQASESRGESKIISRPKITTMNNVPATITAGQTYQVKTATAATATVGGSATPATTGSLESITAGLSLQVTPLIIGQDLIKLQVNLTNSQSDIKGGIDGLPVVTDNSANTSIIVRNGRTAVIAGLIKKDQGETSTGVPFLQHIPVLGWLFRSHSQQDIHKELVVLLTPRLITPDMLNSGPQPEIKEHSAEDAERKPTSKP